MVNGHLNLFAYDALLRCQNHKKKDFTVRQ